MTVVTVDAVLGTDDFERANETPLASPYLAWLTGGKPNLSSGAAVDNGAFLFDSSTTRPETVGPGCYAGITLDTAAVEDGISTYYVATRLSTHDNAATGYTATMEPGTSSHWKAVIRCDGATIATSEVTSYTDVSGVRLKSAGDQHIGYLKVSGEWVEAVSVVDDTHGDAGYVGFGLATFLGTPSGIEDFTWGTSELVVSPVGDRFYGRLEPLAYDDETQDFALRNLCIALMTPVEITEIARDSDDGLVAWEPLFDPDACPVELLDWLAVFNGVVLPPSALTAAEKRYRIKQAAGRYRGTPRALVEEIQLVLTGAKTVLMSFQSPDRWTYAVGTIDAETPDEDAVEAAIMRQNPAFMLWDRLLTSDWSWLVLAPTLVATRDGDTYTIGAPEYPTWQDVIDAFSDWQHVIDNDPDL